MVLKPRNLLDKRWVCDAFDRAVAKETTGRQILEIVIETGWEAGIGCSQPVNDAMRSRIQTAFKLFLWLSSKVTGTYRNALAMPEEKFYRF